MRNRWKNSLARYVRIAVSTIKRGGWHAMNRLSFRQISFPVSSMLAKNATSLIEE